MLIHGAKVIGRGPTDVRIAEGRIVECAQELRPRLGEDEIDAQGGWLLPGLHDHHVHLRAVAAAAASVRTGPPAVRTREELAMALRGADRALPQGRWIRGVGYHQSVAGELDRLTLDGMVPDRPVRVQHRSGAMWVLNSRAAELVGLEKCELPGVERDAAGAPTGRLWRQDSWLAERIGPTPLDFAAVSESAARRGVTGFTDATPGMSDREIGELAEAVRCGAIRQRVHCMAPPAARDPAGPRFSLGPVKVILDDDTLPALDDFVAMVRSAHAADRPVAVHCVTRTQLVLTQLALDEAGVRAGDRIEHGAIVPAEALPWLRERGVTVVTQPHFVAERGEQYAREVPAADLPDLWRLRSLQAAGVRVAAGTDAPFGTADPWSVIAAACARGSGALPHRDEAIALRAAVQLFLGRADAPAVPRTVEPGAVADLALLRPRTSELFRADPVAATIVAGEIVYVAAD